MSTTTAIHALLNACEKYSTVRGKLTIKNSLSGQVGHFYLDNGAIYAVSIDGYVPPLIERLRITDRLDDYGTLNVTIRESGGEDSMFLPYNLLRGQHVDEGGLREVLKDFFLTMSNEVLSWEPVTSSWEKNTYIDGYPIPAIEGGKLMQVLMNRQDKLDSISQKLGIPVNEVLSKIEISTDGKEIDFESLSTPEEALIANAGSVENSRLEALVDPLSMTTMSVIRTAYSLWEADVIKFYINGVDIRTPVNEELLENADNSAISVEDDLNELLALSQNVQPTSSNADQSGNKSNSYDDEETLSYDAEYYVPEDYETESDDSDNEETEHGRFDSFASVEDDSAEEEQEVVAEDNDEPVIIENAVINRARIGSAIIDREEKQALIEDLEDYQETDAIEEILQDPESVELAYSVPEEDTEESLEDSEDTDADQDFVISSEDELEENVEDSENDDEEASFSFDNFDLGTEDDSADSEDVEEDNESEDSEEEEVVGSIDFDFDLEDNAESDDSDADNDVVGFEFDAESDEVESETESYDDAENDEDVEYDENLDGDEEDDSFEFPGQGEVSNVDESLTFEPVEDEHSDEVLTENELEALETVEEVISDAEESVDLESAETEGEETMTDNVELDDLDLVIGQLVAKSKKAHATLSEALAQSETLRTEFDANEAEKQELLIRIEHLSNANEGIGSELSRFEEAIATSTEELKQVKALKDRILSLDSLED